MDVQTACFDCEMRRGEALSVMLTNVYAKQLPLFPHKALGNVTAHSVLDEYGQWIGFVEYFKRLEYFFHRDAETFLIGVAICMGLNEWTMQRCIEWQSQLMCIDVYKKQYPVYFCMFHIQRSFVSILHVC